MVVEVVVIVILEEVVTNKIVVENVELKVKLEDVVVLLALEGGGGEQITGHVAQSLMQKRPLEGSSALYSDDVTVANRTSPMNQAFKIHKNKLLINLVSFIWTEVGGARRNPEGVFMA